MRKVLYNGSHILDMNHITPIVNVRTIFGQTAILTAICQILGHRAESDRAFSETGTTKNNILHHVVVEILTLKNMAHPKG